MSNTNTDAQLIGAQLQSLLKIPPIHKQEIVPVLIATPTTLAEIPRINHQHSGETVYARKFKEDKSEKIKEKSEKASDRRGSSGAPTRHRNEFTANTSRIIRRSTPQSERTTDGRSNSHLKEKSMYSGMIGTSVQPSLLNNHDTKMRDKRAESTLKQLIAKPECPCDIKEICDLLVECSSIVDEGRPSYYMALDKTVKSVLGSHYLETLAKKSQKFPKAKFYCSVCNYHMDTVYSGINHVIQDRHSIIEKMRKLDFTLLNIPSPAAEHSAYLTELLVKVSKQYGMNQSEKLERIDVVNRLRNAIEDSKLGCSVTLFGSSASGFGFRDCDVNINVGVEPPTAALLNLNDSANSSKSSISTPAEHSEILTQLISVIHNITFCTEVKEHFTSKVAAVHYTDGLTRTKCKVHFNNTSAVLAAQLFAEYDKIDPRVRILTTTFRYWARVCEIDDQELGMLPSHCYTILVIHFLQQVGVVPVLHAIIRNDADDRLFASADEAKSVWKCHNVQTVGDLWIAMLKYYSCEFMYKDNVVSISSPVNVRRNEKFWNRKLSIEDPILSRSNLSRSVSNNKICDFICDRIKVTYIYFASPRDKKGPLYDGIIDEKTVDPKSVFDYLREISPPRSSDTLQEMVRRMQDVNLTRNIKTEGNLGMIGFSSKDKALFVGDLEKQGGGKHPNVIKAQMTKVRNNMGETQNYVLSKDVNVLHSALYKREYHYEFVKEILQGGTSPPMICKSCAMEGHVRKDCPEETLPPLRSVVIPSACTLQILTAAMIKNYEQETLNDRDVELRQQILNELRTALQPAFETAEFHMFGSTHNGFGLHFSDVDVCMTFRNHRVFPNESPLKNLDVNDILKKVVERLKIANCMQEILAIPSAKVPIVKFRHRASKLEGDISLYNTLAMHNTLLLRTYSDIDPRVKILGCFLKRLTKLCDISEASKGSLSSYGYVLMLIHFLQHHEVPVLPVLQELSPYVGEVPVNMVEGCNVWFYADSSRLHTIWPGYQKNQESVSQLWLAFLRYYTEKFNFNENVITIGQSLPLSRLSKFWHSESLAIEDPFDKSHNLGAGLSRRMSVHILKSFQRFREVFHVSIDGLPQNSDWHAFYMDQRRVRGGNPPIDRQCRLCNRIGHFARSCTFTGRNDEKEAFIVDDDEYDSQVSDGLRIRLLEGDSERIKQDFADMQEEPKIEGVNSGSFNVDNNMELFFVNNQMGRLRNSRDDAPIIKSPDLPLLQRTVGSPLPNRSGQHQNSVVVQPRVQHQVFKLDLRNQIHPEVFCSGLTHGQVRHHMVNSSLGHGPLQKQPIMNNVSLNHGQVLQQVFNSGVGRSQFHHSAMVDANVDRHQVNDAGTDFSTGQQQVIVPGVVFFGGNGSPSQDDKRIATMIQSNAGVTFTLDAGTTCEQSEEQENSNFGSRVSPQIYLSQRIFGPAFPPPGFRGGNDRTVDINGEEPMHHHAHNLTFMNSGFTHSVPAAMGGNPVGNLSYSTRSPVYNGFNPVSTIAPPPGFPPLPNNTNPYNMYTYPTHGVNMSGLHQDAVHQMMVRRQHLAQSSNGPSTNEQNGDDSSIQVQSIQEQIPQNQSFRGIQNGVYADSGYPMVQFQQLPIVTMSHPLPIIPLSMHIANGIQDGLIMTSANSSVVMSSKPNLVMSLAPNEYGNPQECRMLPGGGLAATPYHVSQAHQGSVVSALPMQHSQHHPMHMHHQQAQMRPFHMAYQHLHHPQSQLAGMAMPLHSHPSYSHGSLGNVVNPGINSMCMSHEDHNVVGESRES